MDVVHASWTDRPKAMGEGYIQPAHILIRVLAQTKETKANVTVDFIGLDSRSPSLEGQRTDGRSAGWVPFEPATAGIFQVLTALSFQW